MKSILLQMRFIYASLLMMTVLGSRAQFHETREFKDFTSVEALGTVAVYFTYSDTGSIVVYAAEEEINRVLVSFDGGRITVSNRGSKFTEPVKVYLKHNRLDAVECSGATSFKTLNTVKSDSLFLSLSGSANAKIKTNSRSVKSIQSGASQLNLSGSSNSFYSELSGASSLNAYELLSENVKVTTAGATSAKVYSSSKILAMAGGASSIKIKGDVKDVSAEASPSSSITRIVEKSSAKTGEPEDSTVYNWKGRKIIIIDKEDDDDKTGETYSSDDYFDGFRHWAGFSFGVNGFVDPNMKTQISAPYDYMNIDYSKSFNYQFNLFENHIKLVNRNLMLITGLGFDYHSYELENKVKLIADGDFTGAIIDSTSNFTYKKNRLRNTYLQVPLLLEFNTSNSKRNCFHIAASVIGQYQLLSRTRQLLEQEAYEYDIQRKDPYNTNPFMLKAHLNLGYSGWTFYGEYCITPLFQKNKGPELYPFAVGLRVIPFDQW